MHNVQLHLVDNVTEVSKVGKFVTEFAKVMVILAILPKTTMFS